MIRRPSAHKPQRSIELHIDELVLHGLPLTSSQGRVVQAAVETELARLLIEQGLSSNSAGAESHLPAGSIQLTENNQPEHLARKWGQLLRKPGKMHPVEECREGVIRLSSALAWRIASLNGQC